MQGSEKGDKEYRKCRRIKLASEEREGLTAYCQRYEASSILIYSRVQRVTRILGNEGGVISSPPITPLLHIIIHDFMAFLLISQRINRYHSVSIYFTTFYMNSWWCRACDYVRFSLSYVNWRVIILLILYQFMSFQSVSCGINRYQSSSMTWLLLRVMFVDIA